MLRQSTWGFFLKPLVGQLVLTAYQDVTVCTKTCIIKVSTFNYMFFCLRPCKGVTCFLSGPPAIQKGTPNKNLGTPSFGSQNGPLKPPSTYLGLKVPNLQILRIGDLSGMSTSSIMSFHNVDPKLVHRLSRAQQDRPRGLRFVDWATPL